MSTTRELFVLMAAYNEWMNAKVYQAASELSEQELTADKGAFFGSIFGTLQHIVVGDRIWLRRFADHPARPVALDPIRDLPVPTTLEERLFDDFDQLREHRSMLDTAIKRWSESLSETDLNRSFRYTNLKGVVTTKSFASLVLHFFNHQTHHRGQVTTLLSQSGKDVGVTDLLALIPDKAAADVV